MVKYRPDLQRRKSEADGDGDQPDLRRFLYGDCERGPEGRGQLHGHGDKAVERQLQAAGSGDARVYHRPEGDRPELVQNRPDLQRAGAAADGSDHRPGFERHLYCDAFRRPEECGQLYGHGQRPVERELRAACGGDAGIYHRPEGGGLDLGNHVLYLRRPEPRARGNGHGSVRRRYMCCDGGRRTEGHRQIHGHGQRPVERELCAAFDENPVVQH